MSSDTYLKIGRADAGGGVFVVVVKATAAAAAARRHHLVHVTALEEDEPRGLAGGVLALEVEENVLEEDKVPHLPLAVLRGALEEVATLAVVVQRLLRQRQQLKLVHSHDGDRW